MDKRHYDHSELQKIRSKHFTQEAIAEVLKKHPKTISRAETGVSASFQLLSAMTAACNKSVKDIIYETPLAK